MALFQTRNLIPLTLLVFANKAARRSLVTFHPQNNSSFFTTRYCQSNIGDSSKFARSCKNCKKIGEISKFAKIHKFMCQKRQKGAQQNLRCQRFFQSARNLEKSQNLLKLFNSSVRGGTRLPSTITEHNHKFCEFSKNYKNIALKISSLALQTIVPFFSEFTRSVTSPGRRGEGGGGARGTLSRVDKHQCCVS